MDSDTTFNRLAACAYNCAEQPASLLDAIGGLLAMPREQLATLSGRPAQVMAAQFVYYMKSFGTLEEAERCAPQTFLRLQRCIECCPRWGG